jgi:HAD superfamily hydrolase (TIGR01549 family)
MSGAREPAAILDIDGTLVDSNYHHAIAWYRAFRAHDIVLPLWRIHRHIGMGGDQLVAAVAGEEVERERGEDIRAAETERYGELIEEVRPLEGARELIEDLKRDRRRVVLASSAKPQEVEHYLDLLDGRELADAWTTAGDVEHTKPDPDLIHAALDRLDSDRAVMVGDSTWDCRAARNAGVETLAVLTGGFSAQELFDAGALSVFATITELRARLPFTALG